MRPGGILRIHRGHLMLSSLAVALILWVLTLIGPGVMSAEKAGEGPPPPPAAVDEYGNPWKAVVQEEALQRAHLVPPAVKEVLRETPAQRKKRLEGKPVTLNDQKFSYLVLESPLINEEEDQFTGVRFMHKKHAAVLGDCMGCHHFRPAEPDASEIVRCSACHRKSFEPDRADRIGLKAAYHRQCMDCHKERNQGPVGCTECHAKKVPDHTKLVKLPEKPSPMEVTRECLRCHDNQGEEMLKSAHWLWRGPSPFTEGHEKNVHLGKATNTINNFCIALPSNWPRCTSCHAGYGWRDGSFDFSDKSRIDCLVCHDTTETYAKAPPGAGMPYPEVDLVKVAQNVGKPSRKTCGDCHFSGGGGDAVKHGDMNSILYYPTKECDVHMGGMNFQCQECHKTRNHQIMGRSLSAPVAEGSRSCENCHTAVPHPESSGNLLAHHLNRHTTHIACNTCHSPIYAKCRATKTWWDWSKAGDKSRKPAMDHYGMPDYSWMKGEFRWKESAKPDYRWYNGKVRRYVLGDPIGTEAIIKLTEPVGAMRDPSSKITPFKLMEGIQMADARQDMLIVPHLFGPGGYWDKLDWQTAFHNGMKAAGLSYSGDHKWVRTIMYWGLKHEVTPKDRALSCVQCHSSLKDELSCGRCHQQRGNLDFKELARRGIDFKVLHSRGRDTLNLAEVTDYIDFRKLGYAGDPVLVGGRFKQLPLGKPPVLGEEKAGSLKE